MSNSKSNSNHYFTTSNVQRKATYAYSGSDLFIYRSVTLTQSESRYNNSS